MSGASKGKQQMNFQVTQAEQAYVAKRAEALGWKKSTYATRIVKLWFSMGCPAVHPAEAALLTLKRA